MLVDMLRSMEDLLCLKPASAEQVTGAEKVLGLKFAKEYVDYLLEYGAAAFGYVELTGICQGERLNVVGATKRARERYPQFPCSLYVVEEMGIDRIVIAQDGEGMVYQYGPSDSAQKIGESMEEYFLGGEEEKNLDK